MKKLYILLTIFLSFFVFCGSVEASKELIDGRWDAKCVYCDDKGCFNLYYNDDEFYFDVQRSNVASASTIFDISDIRLHRDVTGCPEYIYEYYLEEDTAIGQVGDSLEALWDLIVGNEPEIETFSASYFFWEPQLGVGIIPNYTYSLCNAEDLTGMSCSFTTHHLHKILINEDQSIYIAPDNEPTGDIENCGDLLGPELIDTINDIMNIVRIAVPIILIGFGVMDFTKAIFGGKEEEMSKSRKTFINRIIAAIIVFIIPIFVNLVLTLANEVWDYINPTTCIE